MSTTNLTADEILTLALRGIVSELVRGPEAGIGTDDCGQYCLYCNWQHLDYEAQPKHDVTCVITRGRAILDRNGKE